MLGLEVLGLDLKVGVEEAGRLSRALRGAGAALGLVPLGYEMLRTRGTTAGDLGDVGDCAGDGGEKRRSGWGLAKARGGAAVVVMIRCANDRGWGSAALGDGGESCRSEWALVKARGAAVFTTRCEGVGGDLRVGKDGDRDRDIGGKR